MKKLFKKLSKVTNKMDPTQIMVMGFALLILIGGLLLNLPMATQNGEQIGFLNALFTATSAVCVTGLVVVDTATYWSGFGQGVIVCLIQIGGLGFMTITTMFAIIARKRINLRERLLIQESLNQFDLSGLVKLTRYILLTTFAIEGIGAILLSFIFIPQFGVSKGIWYSIFHAISAFCNAGFDLMGGVSGEFSSLTSYVNSVTITIVISLLIILGGLGFPVILDVVKQKKFSKLNIHSKIVLISTLSLIISGALIIYALEINNANTLAQLDQTGKITASLFQSVTTRTAGFNTIDLTLMRESTLFVMIIFMFIGASPASTGGGVKTTTIAVLLLSVRTFIEQKQDTEIFKRKLSVSTINKSLGVFVIAFLLALIGTLLISITQPEFTLLESAFEVVSAVATVGLSIGGSPNLDSVGKIIIMILMFMGRVGSLTIFFALTHKGKKKQVIRYPEGKIIVG